MIINLIINNYLFIPLNDDNKNLLQFCCFSCSLLVYIPFPLLLILLLYENPGYYSGISTKDM